MSDRRLTPANGRVAAIELEGQVQASRFVAGHDMQVTGYPFLHEAPQGRRDRQLLWGDTVRVLEVTDNWAFVQSRKDGYVGYVDQALAPPQDLTHRVTAPMTWAYPAADFKIPGRALLYFASQLSVLDQDDRWAKIKLPQGADPHQQEAFVPSGHLQPVTALMSDPVDCATLFLGAPYVWAGNTPNGIDCSGLVQVALNACGIPCPGDSDLQEAALGQTLPPGTPPARGDFLFWKGHVALVRDANTILHANAHHMAVTIEDRQTAIDRIRAAGDGEVTRHARLT